MTLFFDQFIMQSIYRVNKKSQFNEFYNLLYNFQFKSSKINIYSLFIA